MREFDEVGRIVEEFASEDATVVVGTVLDPDMADEVRVTVVATGLGRASARMPIRGSDRDAPMREPMRAPVKLVRNATTGLADFDAMANANANLPPLGQPTAGSNPGLRQSGRGGDTASHTALADLPTDHSYLDIPAFLRRQAD
jgi:cell division protein FtsZ